MPRSASPLSKTVYHSLALYFKLLSTAFAVTISLSKMCIRDRGWATYNGDHMSMYGVNASVPKTLIRHIVALSLIHIFVPFAAVGDVLSVKVVKIRKSYAFGIVESVLTPGTLSLIHI